MSPAACLAVLGDLHGHLTLAWRLVRRWEVEHGRRFDAILQVGDLGAWPDPSRADRATLRFARKDPDELSFPDYHQGSPEADEILGPDAPESRRVEAPMYFVKGNHDDFEFLEGCADPGGSPSPVDAYRRILYLPSGSVNRLEVGGAALTVGSLGGIALQGGPARDSMGPCYTRAEVRSLWARGEEVDILLSHDAPYGEVFEDAGSRDLADFLGSFRPPYHFCGHYHEPGGPLHAPEGTRSYLLNEVSFEAFHRLHPGCFGVLTWASRSRHDFHLVDEPWLGEFNRRSFRDL